MSKEITTEIRLQKNDVVAFAIHALCRRKTFKIVVAIYSVFLLLILSQVLIFKAGLSSFVEAVCLSVALAVFISCVVYIMAVREFKSNKRLSEAFTCFFDEKSYRIQGESFDMTCSWEKVYGLTETKKYFFVWQSRSSAHIIPKRDLLEEDFEFFRTVR